MQLTTGLCSTLMTLTLLTAMPTAHAANTPAASASSELSAIHNFVLSEGFLQKWQAAKADIAKDPCRLAIATVDTGDSDMDSDAPSQSMEQTAASYDAKPGVHAMLASHGLTARDMVVGTTVIAVASAEYLLQSHPELGRGATKSRISAANMAFYQRHKEQIHQFNTQLAKQQLQAAGGKLPSCLTH